MSLLSSKCARNNLCQFWTQVIASCVQRGAHSTRSCLNGWTERANLRKRRTIMELVTKDQAQPSTQFPPSESDDDKDRMSSYSFVEIVPLQAQATCHCPGRRCKLPSWCFWQLASLDVCHSLKPTFTKLNTPLTASAACERLRLGRCEAVFRIHVMSSICM